MGTAMTIADWQNILLITISTFGPFFVNLYKKLPSSLKLQPARSPSCSSFI